MWGSSFDIPQAHGGILCDVLKSLIGSLFWVMETWYKRFLMGCALKKLNNPIMCFTSKSKMKFIHCQTSYNWSILAISFYFYSISDLSHYRAHIQVHLGDLSLRLSLRIDMQNIVISVVNYSLLEAFNCHFQCLLLVLYSCLWNCAF